MTDIFRPHQFTSYTPGVASWGDPAKAHAINAEADRTCRHCGASRYNPGVHPNEIRPGTWQR